MAAAFFDIPFGGRQFTKDEFLNLVSENGIKCENCENFTAIYPDEGICGHLQTAYQRDDLDVKNDFFCASFNPKSNG